MAEVAGNAASVRCSGLVSTDWAVGAVLRALAPAHVHAAQQRQSFVAPHRSEGAVGPCSSPLRHPSTQRGRKSRGIGRAERADSQQAPLPDR